MPQVAEAFSRVLGRTVRFVEQPIEQVRSFSKDYAVTLEWFNREGYKADIAALRALYPGLDNFQAWLRKSGWAQATARA